jgi:GNAT superfamily N-acetyltransferase
VRRSLRSRRREYRLVEGAAFRRPASELLRSVWRPPALFYSAEYLEWQLSFPGPFPAPAVAAFDGLTLAGFAASMHRRVRYGSAAMDALVVSFVSVHPDFRNRGIAAHLYAHLLGAIGERGVPAITYAQAASAGERAIERSYPRAGFVLHSFGAFPVYGFLVRSETDAQAWVPATAGEELAILRSLINGVNGGVDGGIAGEGRICSDPSEAQIAHYLRDPRGRHLLVERNGDGDAIGAAWVVQVEHTGANGTHSVITIDCVWLSRGQARVLPGLAAAAARLWSEPSSQPGWHERMTVQASSLGGFDPQAARQVGFRQIATPFQGYVAVSSARHPLCEARGSNLEIV